MFDSTAGFWLGLLVCGFAVLGCSGGGNAPAANDLDRSPADIVTVDLEVGANAIQQLDANPFDGPDVVGAFVDDAGTRYDPIEVNYRGAYALQNLIRAEALQRNWKLKFSKEQPYLARREWNFNYEPHMRQQIAYWLMHAAGVEVPTAEHLVLRVNGTVHGLTLRYEDPDNKSWLADSFGDDDGDLYKAAYDIPGQAPYFATLEVLGTTDADYAMHYRKMTNNDDPTKAEDFSALRTFIIGLNDTADDDFEAFLRGAFEVDAFLGYLVVANFISHWDSLPQRPKNFWLYQVSATRKWVFIPWDMDATFQSAKFTFNPMGTDASVFYQFDGFVDYKGRIASEGTARPLITRMMKVSAFRSAYVTRYRQALSTYLAKDYLLARISTLYSMAMAAAQPEELSELADAQADMENFVAERYASVTAELAGVP